MTDVALGAADRGRTIEVTQGYRVLLRLPENSSTGYRWELEQLEGDALKLQADTYHPSASPALGAGGVRGFDFLARSPGNAVLRLRLRRPWEPAGPAAETFEVTVQVSPHSGSGP